MTTRTESAPADREDAGQSGADDLPAEPARPAGHAGHDLLEWSEIDARRADVDHAWLDARLRAAIDALGHPVARVGIGLLDDAAMANLHVRHLAIEGPTDVLTFVASPPGEPVDVDIAIGLDVARRSAAARGHDASREVLLYAVHGLLHATGYDDRDPEAFARMHVREDEILTAIGVGAVFADESPGAST